MSTMWWLHFRFARVIGSLQCDLLGYILHVSVLIVADSTFIFGPGQAKKTAPCDDRGRAGMCYTSITGWVICNANGGCDFRSQSKYSTLITLVSQSSEEFVGVFWSQIGRPLLLRTHLLLLCNSGRGLEMRLFPTLAAMSSRSCEVLTV